VLADGRRLAAEAVTSDPATGLALIKVPGEGFPFLNLRRNSTPRQGDWSVAVANPYGSGAVVAAGVVMGGSAALGDAFGDFLRIGADLGPAFSGAPVIDAQGRVIGVHTAPPGSAPSGRADVLAAPLTGALIDQLKTGRVDRGRLGLIAIDLTPNAGGTNPLDRRRGAVVAQLAHDSAAARAGLRAGDVIARLNGAEVRDAAALAQLILAVPTAAPLRLSVRRGERIFEATLSPAPALQAESAQNGKK
jgi:S1-C subfamily serine protease